MITLGLYLVAVIALFLYSYGYLDYNLTLSNHPIFLRFVDYFQDIVFFNRPLSTNIYLAILAVMTVAYLLTLATHKKKITSFPWKIIITIAIIAGFDYPLFTHDVYNYLFHARAVITHHANPHLISPQEFVGDEWLRFMHWVHSPSAYGYGFTGYMIVPYVLGLTKLTLSLYFYKVFSLLWYLLAVWLIGKIALRNKLIDPALAQLIFALNPLVVMEFLINAHNENLMVTLMLLSWYLVGEKKIFKGLLAIIYASFAKYAAVLAIPGLFLMKIIGERKSLLLTSAILIIVPFIYHYPGQYQVWYITWALPFVILSANRYLIAGILGYAFGGLLTYVPYISTGFWSLPASSREIYLLLPAVIFQLSYVIYWFIAKKHQQHIKQR